MPPDVHRLALAAHEMTERLRGAPAYDTQILATAQALSLTAMLDLLVDEYEAARLGRPAWCPDAVEP